MLQDIPDHLSVELDRLSPSQRRAVIEALRHSHDSGFPASDAAARLLIAYAAGHIDAREYARQTLVSLGAVPAAPTVPAATPAPSSREPERLAPRPPVAPVTPRPQGVESRRISREEAVQAYVSGRIPVAEFLRIARGA